MTGCSSLFGNPVLAANDVRKRVYRELGFTVNVGVSCNKLLAKMASDFQKPNRVHTLFPEEMERKMWPLPVSDLFFVGKATNKKLMSMGINTIGELAHTDVDILRANLKKHGEILWNFANGYDFSSVISQPLPNKGYGNSTTIAFDVEDTRTAKLVLLALAETVCSRLRENKVKTEVVSVGIRDYNLRYWSHQMTLPNATNNTNEIYQMACQIFDQSWDGTPIRHLGIHTRKIRDEAVARQINMFDATDYEKLENVDQAIDQVRLRYGKDALVRAAFIKSKIDHMSGGISREKRSVDYSKLIIE